MRLTTTKKPFHAMSDDFDELGVKPSDELIDLDRRWYKQSASYPRPESAVNPEPDEFNEEWAQIEAEKLAGFYSSCSDAFIAGARWMFEQLRKK